jgi:type I restriction enzyme S subunit
MNKYQSYKPSGVEWIGKIPEEWSIIKLGYLGKLKSGNGFSENLQGREIGGDFPFFKVSDTNNEGNEMYLVRGNNYVSNDDYIENKWYLFPKHTVVFPKIGMVLLMNKRRILNQPSFIDNNMMGFIPNSHIQFLFSFYLLKLIDFKNYCSDGTVPSIGESQISSIKVVLPPLEQQHQIVQFLDEKTELIDKLISTKERKITLLKEQRTSVINQIVTKGLNPNVKMKDSGVEWIGEIPEHWRFIKFSYLIIKSDLGGNYESSTENDGVPLIKMGNLGRGKVNLNKVE